MLIAAVVGIMIAGAVVVTTTNEALASCRGFGFGGNGVGFGNCHNKVPGPNRPH